ncbi:D-serine ammonia-lyase [Aliicoccus persicus]|uniref:Probable D-serine dehydratase n=1 Tax=Aliicoccus persicus TaxID=930138 RepID=A0A662Z7J5_9STAP|nr:D-serine ammonia-lyase [Aliicoccus persicus]SEW19072.1 D-serine ammonia-lyase [Aliicoccus persicus]
MDIEQIIFDFPAVSKLIDQVPSFFENPTYTDFELEKDDMGFSLKDIKSAEARMKRFQPYFMEVFKETIQTKAIIESPIVRMPTMKESLESIYDVKINNNVYLKLDNLLPIAGSVKARGGIYNVLKFAEHLARDEMVYEDDSDYTQFLEDHCKDVFSSYRLICGSTGNLGMAVGLIGSKLGFQTEIHMSKEAQQWKKDKLRNIGVQVIEHDTDFNGAVKRARLEALKSKRAHFVDDENSKSLFIGYAVAALRLKEQLDHAHIEVSESRPLFVYIPCGVGGAPGGISFGLKQMYGDAVHPIFMEPVASPSFTLGALTKMHNEISIKDIGLSGETLADGLAVSRPSKFVGKLMASQIYGYMTVEDKEMFRLLKELRDTEGFKVEPSAAAALIGPAMLSKNKDVNPNATHLVWLTGGSDVPSEIYSGYYDMGDF